eukprot:EG_transcript_43018
MAAMSPVVMHRTSSEGPATRLLHMPRGMAQARRVIALQPRPVTVEIPLPSVALIAVPAVKGAVQQVPIVRRTSPKSGPATPVTPRTPLATWQCPTPRQLLPLHRVSGPSPSPRHMPVVRINGDTPPPTPAAARQARSP